MIKIGVLALQGAFAEHEGLPIWGICAGKRKIWHDLAFSPWGEDSIGMPQPPFRLES